MTEANGKKDIRVIVLDVDGTLLDSKHELTPRVEKALKAAAAKGAQIVLATGKTRASMLKVIDQLGLKTPGIYLQGLAIYDGEGELRHQMTLDPALARQVLTFGEDRGYHMVAYSGARIMAHYYNKEIEAGWTEYHEVAPEVVGPLQNLLEHMAFNKLIACGEPKAVKALRWQLNAQVGGAARLMQAGIPTMLEILPPGGSKGAALKVLLKDLKVAPENVMAVGDAENDIEMIQLAGIGVAMGHSEQAVKNAADHVTGTNDEDGVAQVIERFVLDGDAKPEAEKQESTAKPKKAKAEQTATQPETAEAAVPTDAEEETAP